MKKVLFLDRDGTIIKEPADEQVDTFAKLDFLPNVITWLGRIAREMDYELVMVTNQDGLGTASFPESDFWPIQNFMINLLANEGINFSNILIDRSFAEENSPDRKPRTGMLTPYIHGEYDLARSFVIGDRVSDLELARNIGAKGIYINEASHALASFNTTSWKDIYHYLHGRHRTASVRRKTSETDISINLNLDGGGKSNISTGLSFFDHMLEQLGRHGGIDLEIKAQGDLHIDEHHTIEDTALALGKAFDMALGSRKNLARYGFSLPMDESIAHTSVDFGGRSGLEWKADFKRERIGDVPTEMFSHFFKSFCSTARCTLHVEARGKNEHHLIEAIFKSFSRSIRQALSEPGDNIIPSTKGVL